MATTLGPKGDTLSGRSLRESVSYGVRVDHSETVLPLVCYQVGGEYAMIRFAADAGALDEAATVRESLLAMKRAGANLIVSYYARNALREGWIN